MFDDEPYFESMEETRQWRDERRIAAIKQAEIEAEQIDWENNKTSLKEALSNLGGNIAEEYYNLAVKVTVSNGIITTDIPSDIHTKAMFSEKLLWIAERQAAIFGESFTSGFANASGAFFNYLSILSNDGDTPIANFDKWYQPMWAISLVFFNQADALMQKSNVAETLDKVAEAFLANGYHDYMLWHEIGGEDDYASRQRSNVRKKLDADPKQIAKKFVKDCWLTWQEEPERYKSKAAFAKDMLKQEQCKSLESQVKITDWCREWEKSHPAG